MKSYGQMLFEAYARELSWPWPWEAIELPVQTARRKYGPCLEARLDQAAWVRIGEDFERQIDEGNAQRKQAFEVRGECLYKERELRELRHESDRLSADTGRNCDAIYRAQSDIDDIKIVRRLDERLARLEADLVKAKKKRDGDER